MNTHVDLSPSWQVKVWENKRLWAGKGHGAGKKTERWKKRAWRCAMLKGAGGNTTFLSVVSHFEMQRMLLQIAHLFGRLYCMSGYKKSFSPF